MNEALLPALKPAATLPTDYEPTEGLKAVAVAEAAEIHFARAKDATRLYEAIELKLVEQRRFVLWWDGHGLRKGGKPSQNNDGLETAADLGLDRDTIHRWRKRLCSDGGFDSALEKAKSRCLKIAEFHSSASGIDNHLTQGSGENEWYTPREFIALAREVMGGIDLDPASSAEANKTVAATEFYTIEDDGLDQQWRGRIWLNPPYSRDLMPKFMDKLKSEYTSGNVRAAIMVTHNNTDTGWFHSLADVVSAICFVSKRIKFYRGDIVAAPVNGHMFLYFGTDIPAFTSAFGSIGFVMVPA